MVDVKTIKAGDILYDCHREKMGNTTISRMGTWEVRIIDIVLEPYPRATVSWNGNRSTIYYRRQLERLRRNKPKPRVPHA